MNGPELPLAVIVLGCVDGIAHGAANHTALAVTACLAAFAGLWLLLEPGETR